MSHIERVAAQLRAVNLPTKPSQAHIDLLMRIAGIVHDYEKSQMERPIRDMTVEQLRQLGRKHRTGGTY